MFEKLFHRGISRPTPAVTTAPTGEQQLPHTTIFIRPAVLPGGGSYITTVMQHLAEIQSFPLGAKFIQDLSALGKRQLIVYGGAGANQAAGTTAAYVLLRLMYDQMDKAGFGAEFKKTLAASGKTTATLAKELVSAKLPRWNGTVDRSPFAHAPMTAAKPGLPRTPVEIEKQLNDWIGGTGLPSKDEMDVLCLALEPWLERGKGVSTRINYDPHKTHTAAGSRPPHVALFHELVHAYYNANGTQLGREDSVQEENGGRLFELMSVGLPPFDQRPYSENKFRAALGVGPRSKYP
ncbi:MAG: hypothetical protein HRU75_13110 [Planctomycetia bacterium]|nr:MAG: hypothetical protein HRU75_13110 [Planctomycetia bacterium]